ncbi:MAG TPA: hypothetical protein DEA08_32720, partial [Planctomycetes bacterium]|nr:hypothetical protein [Planctomycetota bacterium]
PEQLSGGARLLVGELPLGEPALLRELGDRALAGELEVALLHGPWRGRRQVLLALGSSALARGWHARDLLRATLAPLGGGGGGRRAELAEGAAPLEADFSAGVAALREQLVRQ